MRKTTVLAAVMAALLARRVDAGDLTGYVDVTSRYIARGTDQNIYGDPSAQGGLTYMATNGLYAPAFASTMNFGEGATKEIDVFAGKKTQCGKTTIDLGFASLNYPRSRLPWNFVEYDLKVDHPVGRGNMGAWLGYTDHYFNIFGRGIWTEAHGIFPVASCLSISGAVANQDLPNNCDYRTFNVGATYLISPSVAAEFRYSDTDRHDLDLVYGTYGQRMSVTLTKSF